ncbi:MAG: hypothetical protein ACN4GM_00655 [Gammaproteobacteria bacterium]
MKQSSIKRKTIFIQPHYQKQSIMIVVGIIAVSGLFSGLLLYLLLSSELSSELQVAHTQIENTWESLAPVIFFGNILTVLVTSIVAAIAVLYQSHKIAGPMYRMQRICDEVAGGNLSPVTSLRKTDQLMALASSFEMMVQSLQEQRGEICIKVSNAKVLLSSIEKESDADKREKAIRELELELKSICEP